MSWADRGSDPEDAIEIGSIRCQYCGQPFLEVPAKKNHEASCGDDGDGDGESGLNRSPNEDSELFTPFLDWLRQETDGEAVRFQGRTVADRVGLTPKQIGVFMPTLERSEDWIVERLGYSDRTMWEVRRA